MLQQDDIQQRIAMSTSEQYKYLPALVPSIIPENSPILTFFIEQYEKKDKNDKQIAQLPQLSARPFERVIDTINPYLLEPESKQFYVLPQQLVVYFHGQQQPCVYSAFQRAGFVVAPRQADKRFNICWGHPLGLDFYKTLAPGQLCGQFPGSNAIGRKDTMATLLNQARLLHPRDYDFYPETYNLPDDESLFLEQAQQNSFYIYKPAMLSEGRGIELFLKHDYQSVVKPDVPAVIQKYVDNLLIVNGFKFDLRIYVLVTSIDPMIFYLYDEGLGRFATTPYHHVNQENYQEKTMHLTNFSINYKEDGFHMDGFPSKWKISELLNYLEQHREFFAEDSQIRASNSQTAVHDVVVPKIKDLIIKTLLAVEPRMSLFSHNAGLADVYPRRNFGLYGFDIMLLQNGDPLLVEINKSPSKNTKTQIDVDIKYQLMCNTLDLVGYSPAFFQTGLSCIPERFADEQEAKIASYGGSIKSPDSRRYKQFQLRPDEKKYSFKTGQQLFNEGRMEDLTRFERRCLFQIVDEQTRLGKFERLWPNQSTNYLLFLQEDRYLSWLCVWFLKQGDQGIQKLIELGLK